MTESLCPLDFLQFEPMLAVHDSILLLNADWSGRTETDYEQRHYLKEDFPSKLIVIYYFYI